MTTENVSGIDKPIVALKYAYGSSIGRIMRKIGTAIGSRKDLASWWDLLEVVLLYAGVKRQIAFRLSDGTEVKAASREDYTDAIHDYCNTNMEIDLKPMEKDYGFLEVKGRKVVDIGANVGDSVVYFLASGATHVWAYEPYPYVFGFLKKNVAKASKSRATLVNKAITGKPRKMTISEDYRSGQATALMQFRKGKTIEAITLQKALEEITGKNLVLKCDCEGGEYEIFLGASNEVLSRFSQIALEYHHGYLDLQKKLEGAGFVVRHTVPKYDFRTGNIYGMIYASTSIGE